MLLKLWGQISFEIIEFALHWFDKYSKWHAAILEERLCFIEKATDLERNSLDCDQLDEELVAFVLSKLHKSLTALFEMRCEVQWLYFLASGEYSGHFCQNHPEMKEWGARFICTLRREKNIQLELSTLLMFLNSAPKDLYLVFGWKAHGSFRSGLIGGLWH